MSHPKLYYKPEADLLYIKYPSGLVEFYNLYSSRWEESLHSYEQRYMSPVCLEDCSEFIGDIK